MGDIERTIAVQRARDAYWKRAGHWPPYVVVGGPRRNPWYAGDPARLFAGPDRERLAHRDWGRR